MSTEHHPPDPSSPADHPPHGDAHVVARPPSETDRDDPRPNRENRTGPDRDLETRRALENRIERARLRVRVAALERSLAEQERRRQALVDQYETILEDRGGDPGRLHAASASGNRPRSDAASVADGSADDPSAGDGSAEATHDRGGPLARLRGMLPTLRP